MASRSPSDPNFDLDRIRKQQNKKVRAPLRIMIATDPTRPIRTISLPRSLPMVVSVSAIVLITATVLLACGSWKLNGSLGALQHRVQAMVRAADSVALRDGGETTSAGVFLSSAGGPAARNPSGPIGRFVVQSANNGEEMTVEVNLATGEMEAGA